MAQNVTLLGASYSDVPAVTLPATGGGEAVFYDPQSLDIPPHMSLLSYGKSTWQDFINAYNSNSVVYCRASSNSNPASGSQTRLAFMAYVNNATPTEVEFQYYRSVATHSDSQQGDQVYVYKLNKTSGWSVIVRSAFSKIVAGSGLTSSYSNGTLTLKSKAIMTTATLSSSNWSGNAQTVNVTGVTASNIVIASPAPASAEDWADAGIMCTGQSSGKLTFKCATTPSSNVTVNVMYGG